MEDIKRVMLEIDAELEKELETLKVFFEPKRVALIGVSTKLGNYNLYQSMKSFGYQGLYYPVNPKGGYILGEKIYRSVKEIPEPIDLAVIFTAREIVPQAVEECIVKGIKALVIVTQGFADGDEEGRLLQEKITTMLRKSGVRAVGPNTMGVFNTFNNFSTGFVPFVVPNKPIGVVSQSGIFIGGASFLTSGLGLGVDIANTCDVNFPELIYFYAQDPRLKVISLHMEDVKDGPKFRQAAAAVSRKKPILVLKTGRTAEGARAASSHTGALAGEDAVYDAVFRQTGIIRAKDDLELYNLNRTFVTFPPLKGKRIAIITVAGGPGIIAVDACAEAGLELAKLSQETINQLKNFFPHWMKVNNPIDIWAASMTNGYRRVFREAMEATLADPNVDALCIIVFAVRPYPTDAVIDIACEVSQGNEKPIIFWLYGSFKEEHTRILEEKGLLAFSSLEQGLKALGKLYHYWAFIHNRPLPEFKSFADVNRDRVKTLLNPHLGKKEMLSASSVYEVLKAYRIPVAETRLAGNSQEILESAAKIYPVVLKAAGKDITHKKDLGGVRLNLQTPAELEQAYQEMLLEIERKAPSAKVENFLIQPYITGGFEVIIGAKYDAHFGPVVAYGTGGIFTEIMKDISFRAAPLSIQDAEEMIRETKSFAILKGARGQKPLDVKAVKETILRVSQLVTDFPEITEMDLNPLIVKEDGVMAVDARMLVK